MRGFRGLTPALDALEAVAAPLSDDVNVYRWYDPTMRLPALWHWLAPSTVERQPNPCLVRDLARITVSIASQPSSSTADDAIALETLADRYLELVDLALAPGGLLGAHVGNRRLGMSFATDRLGDAPMLTLEVPLELVLERELPPNP